MIATFWTRVQAKVTPVQSPGRIKQWLGMMQRIYPQAGVLFREIREARKAPEVSLGLERGGVQSPQ
jgi:tRNA-dihydrouridine synthase C